MFLIINNFIIKFNYIHKTSFVASNVDSKTNFTGNKNNSPVHDVNNNEASVNTQNIKQ